MTDTIIATNPLPADIDWQRVGAALGARIMQGLPDGQVVLPTGVGEGKADLLGAEREEVNRLRKLPDGRIVVTLEVNSLAGSDLALLDPLKDQGSAARKIHHSPPSAFGLLTEIRDLGAQLVDMLREPDDGLREAIDQVRLLIERSAVNLKRLDELGAELFSKLGHGSPNSSVASAPSTPTTSAPAATGAAPEGTGAAGHPRSAAPGSGGAE